jgi:hypothetical protein
MNIWLIGGGAYVVALFFALALCGVAARRDSDATQRGACATRPGYRTAAYEELVGPGTDHTDVVAHRETGRNLSVEVPGSRPRASRHRSDELRKASRRPQPSPRAKASPGARSLNSP